MGDDEELVVSLVIKSLKGQVVSFAFGVNSKVLMFALSVSSGNSVSVLLSRNRDESPVLGRSSDSVKSFSVRDKVLSSASVSIIVISGASLLVRVYFLNNLLLKRGDSLASSKVEGLDLGSFARASFNSEPLSVSFDLVSKSKN